MSETSEEFDAYDQPELDALGYLQAVYQGKVVAETPRMKAAIEALPFERPKLAVTVSATDGRSFAVMMKEIARASGRSNVIDAPKPSAQEVLEPVRR